MVLIVLLILGLPLLTAKVVSVFLHNVVSQYSGFFLVFLLTFTGGVNELNLLLFLSAFLFVLNNNFDFLLILVDLPRQEHLKRPFKISFILNVHLLDLIP